MQALGAESRHILPVKQHRARLRMNQATDEAKNRALPKTAATENYRNATARKTAGERVEDAPAP